MNTFTLIFHQIMYENKKIGGVLIESKLAHKSCILNIGIGLNVNESKFDFPEELQNSSISLKEIKGHPIQKFTTRGSGLKFCLIADGTAHLYPRFVPTCEWDTCAAHAMLLQTGGDIIDYKSGQRLSYGKTFAAYRNGPLITGTKEVLDIILPLPQL